MKVVSRFEANLLRILHGILQRAPVEQVVPLVQKRLPRPVCLRKEAVELVQEALAKGTVWILAREGWRRERYLRGFAVRDGRLWQRTPPAELGLSFSRNALEFLIWTTACEPDNPPPCLPSGELTVGDRLLFFLTYRLLRATEPGPALRKIGFIADNPLCRLAFPEDFTDGAPREWTSKSAKSETVSDWALWTSDVGSCILESLQGPLARRWVEIERSKKQIKSPQRMQAVGRSQERVLESFLQAVTAVQRWDLSRFLLQALAQLLADGPAAQHWIAGLNVRTLRLAERVEVCQAALVLLRHLERLRDWERQARAVGYFDEGYAASQLWKADWERYQGDELCRRAEAILREVEPL